MSPADDSAPPRCPDCGGPLTIHSGEEALEHRVVAWRSYRCGTCPLAMEEDFSEVPAELRTEFLLRDGVFFVVVDDPPRLTEAWVVVRKITRIDLSELLALRRVSPTCVAEGVTRAEAKWLVNTLASVGISAQSHLSTSLP